MKNVKESATANAAAAAGATDKKKRRWPGMKKDKSEQAMQQHYAVPSPAKPPRVRGTMASTSAASSPHHDLVPAASSTGTGGGGHSESIEEFNALGPRRIQRYSRITGNSPEPSTVTSSATASNGGGTGFRPSSLTFNGSVSKTPDSLTPGSLTGCSLGSELFKSQSSLASQSSALSQGTADSRSSGGSQGADSLGSLNASHQLEAAVMGLHGWDTHLSTQLSRSPPSSAVGTAETLDLTDGAPVTQTGQAKKQIVRQSQMWLQEPGSVLWSEYWVVLRHSHLQLYKSQKTVSRRIERIKFA
eukprot:scpid85595/ scgid4506/ 